MKYLLSVILAVMSCTAQADAWVNELRSVNPGAAGRGVGVYALQSQWPNLAPGPWLTLSSTYSTLTNDNVDVFSVRHYPCAATWTDYLLAIDPYQGYFTSVTLSTVTATPGSRLQVQWQDHNAVWHGMTRVVLASQASHASYTFAPTLPDSFAIRWRVIPTAAAPAVCAPGEAKIKLISSNR